MKIYADALTPFGRTNRVAYFGRSFTGGLLIVPAALVARFAERGDLVLPPFELTAASLVVYAALAVAILLMIFGLALIQMAAIRRCHDLGWTGFWTLPLLTASILGAYFGEAELARFVSTPISVLLMFAPGQQLGNKFGPAPEPFDADLPTRQPQHQQHQQQPA